MRCPRCQFENMPGLDRCFQCGSALQAVAGTVPIEPPRMAGWKRPFRNLSRRFRSVSVFPSWFRIPKVPDWLANWTWESYLGIFLSILPGLAHILQKRFGQVRRWLGVWAVLLLLTLFFYGSFWGLMLLGFALGIHAWIACHAGFFREHEDLQPRILAIVLVSIGLFFLYGAVGRYVFSDIVGGQSGVTVPWHQVQVRDYLLGRRSLVRPDALTRGSLVGLRLTAVGGNRMGDIYRMGNEISQIGQIVGLPGDKVQLVENRFMINGQVLDPEKYPVPNWLKNHTLSATMPENHYFCIADYQVRGFQAQAAIRACTIPIQQIRAKVILRWFPLHHRGWIREIE